MKILRIFLFVIADVVLGVMLARYIDSLPIQLPPLIGLSQSLIGLFSTEQVHNPDVVEFVAGMLLLAMSLIVVAVPLFVVARLSAPVGASHAPAKRG